MSGAKNLVFIISDDHRYESLGSSGNAGVASPNLDALAREGTRFTRAHCQGGMHPAVCVPSRACVLTGRNIFASSVDPTGRDYERTAFAIPPDLRTFPEILRGHGYQTYAVGKWHNDRASFARSFDGARHIMFGGMSDHDHVPLHDFDPTGAYPASAVHYEPGLSTDLFRDAAVSFIRGQDGRRPFCLYLAFTAPHDPRTPPERTRVSPDAVPVPANYLPIHPFDNGEMLVRDELLEAFPRTPDAVRRHVADYYGMIGHIDEAIGAIRAALEAQGLADDTVFVYTADHGIALGQHGLLGKQNLYCHSVQVPLIAAGPGVAAGRVVDELTWHADTHATVLGLLGLAPDPGCEGNDVFGAGHRPREHLFAAYRFGQRMARTDRFKLIRYFRADAARRYPTHDGSGTPGTDTEQLFDLAADPLETANLATLPDYADVRDGLARALADWQAAVGDPLLAPDRP
jgi:arylsulfatase A-like enzyme